MLSRPLATTLVLALTASAFCQLGDIGKHLPGIPIPGIPGLDSIFKKGPAITTSLKDAKYEAIDKDNFNPDMKSLWDLKRTPTGGFILQPGGYKGQVQSYCLHAGTHQPSQGDGYIYGPVKGPFEKFVSDVARNSYSHPEIEQHDVQMLLWALVARTKISDLHDNVRVAAEKLLTPKQILDLNGGALGLLTDDKIAGSFIDTPPLLRQAYEAEAHLRNAFSVPGTSYGDFERIAVLTGPSELGKGSRQVPSGRWSLHPDGYYVRYFPSGYPTTVIEIWVPEGSKAIGKEFDPATQIAVPGDTSRQRLIQSGRRKD